MNVHTINKEQRLGISIDKAWDFFSNPLNLSIITPPELGLTITSGNHPEIYPGMIITYQLDLISFIRSNWVTEITHVNKPYFFVDEQKIGPYGFWHHKHFFRDAGEGETVISDLVHYCVPLGPVGDIINRFYIKNSLEKIFNYRKGVLDELFCSKI